ncbi:hypothetical protein HCC36_16120 [Listeria booriae]|uniref:Uncharacterized protein n=1 Tax=Listeria booriae TaxID=1552123 RepID=A0A842GBJ3_9LIST|nr:hypothetical protein [Listeria booriae]MBC2294750.1 hypothetical protein [Listeria booriae]
MNIFKTIGYFIYFVWSMVRFLIMLVTTVLSVIFGIIFAMGSFSSSDKEKEYRKQPAMK